MPPRTVYGPFSGGGDLNVRLTNTEPGHNKFYCISVCGRTLHTEWGSVECSKPQCALKFFESNQAACAAANKVYKEKASAAKGYKRARDEWEADGVQPEKAEDKAAVSVMLAHKYEGDFSAVAHGWWYAEKFDGLRMLWSGTKLMTRTGNTIHAPSWFTCVLPKDLPLDGELWMGYGNDAFNAVNGMVHMLKADDSRWERAQYMVFDAPCASGSLAERVRCLDSVKGIAKHVRVVEYKPVTSAAALQEALDTLRTAGAEGLVLRDSKALYVNGRSKAMLKVKPFQDAEAVVTAYNWQIGGARSLACTMGGQKFSVTVPEAVVESPPPVGSTITVQFFELTAKGVPRFPTYKGVRADV
jgi:DNA ligase-1